MFIPVFVFLIFDIRVRNLQCPQELLACLFDGMAVNLHLLGKELGEPLVLVDAVENELYGLLAFYLYTGFPQFVVVEPCLCPPPHSGAVGIDADQTWNVETLDIDVEFFKWIDNVAIAYGLLTLFFFIPSALVERNTPWRKAR